MRDPQQWFNDPPEAQDPIKENKPVATTWDE